MTNSKTIKKIAIQGIPGAFHEIAARYYHEAPIEVIPEETFPGLIQASTQHDGGMMAIENSIAGTILSNYGLLRGSDLRITGELFLRIRHQLMSMPGQNIADLREVHSHPMAIAQCRAFFQQYPHIRLIETEDTALSAKRIRDNHWMGIGAIASKMAATLYELNILAENIETNKQNYTRFLALERAAKAPIIENADKVSLCFALEHRVGSLHEVLAELVKVSANLTKIKSIPIIGDRWNYLFFIDFTLDDRESLTAVIDAIRQHTTELNVLGQYKSGEHYED